MAEYLVDLNAAAAYRCVYPTASARKAEVNRRLLLKSGRVARVEAYRVRAARRQPMALGHGHGHAENSDAGRVMRVRVQGN